MNYDKFQDCKETLKDLRFKGIAISVAFTVLSVAVCIFAFIRMRFSLFVATLISLTIACIGLSSAIKHNKILKQITKIESNHTYEVKIYRPKIRHMTHTEIRSKYRSNIYYYGITFSDESKKKYYFFFNFEMLNLSKIEIKKIEEKLWRELTLQCYENTSIIKTIENDPYFLRIR